MTQETREAALRAIEDPNLLGEVAEALGGASRRERQNAAAVMGAVAKEHAELLAPYKDALMDALNRPEARTRWECLDALTILAGEGAAGLDDAVDDAEASLFDEESGPVRLAALRFLCKIGALDEQRSEKTWPLIDEAIQCYHGDLEFNEMLAAVTDFSAGALSASVKKQLADRMAFDAANSKGSLKRRAQQIVDNVGGAS